MTLPVRTVLTCWVTVVLTGAVVTHRHDAAPGHTHQLGWAALPTEAAPGDLSFAHRHFLLLGVEFGAVTGQPNADGGCDGTHPAAGEVGPIDGGSRPVDPPTNHDLSVAPVAPSAIDLAPDSGPVQQNRPCPCALISHARTGVLRS